MKIYTIWDTLSGEYFGRGPKMSWATKGGAKNSIMLSLGRQGIKSFSAQTRYECREFDLDAFVTFKVV